MTDTNTAVVDPGEALEPIREHLAARLPGRHFHGLELDAGERLVDPGHRRVVWLREGSARVALEGAWRDERGASIEEATLEAGDLLYFGADSAVAAEAGASLWALDIEGSAPPAAGEVRRLQDLADTSGGCNPGENAFRRLQLTWEETGTDPHHPDGDNTFGSHVVWIEGSKASPHYHPVPARGGGDAQHELYLILDPARFGLAPATRPGIWVNPTPEDENGWAFLELAPGAVASIPAGVAHRGADVLAIVVAVPGFKPDNELVIGPPGAPAAAQESA